MRATYKWHLTKRCCPAHNQNEETRPHHCCFNRSSLASDQTAEWVQTVTVSKPSLFHCFEAASYITDLLICYEPNRALRSADAHLLDVLRCIQRTQGTICRLPCVQQTPSVLLRRNWKHLCLKKSVFTLTYFLIRNVLICNIYQLFYYLFCNWNIINYCLFIIYIYILLLISTIYQLFYKYYLFIFKL